MDSVRRIFRLPRCIRIIPRRGGHLRPGLLARPSISRRGTGCRGPVCCFGDHCRPRSAARCDRPSSIPTTCRVPCTPDTAALQFGYASDQPHLLGREALETASIPSTPCVLPWVSMRVDGSASPPPDTTKPARWRAKRAHNVHNDYLPEMYRPVKRLLSAHQGQG